MTCLANNSCHAWKQGENLSFFALNKTIGTLLYTYPKAIYIINPYKLQPLATYNMQYRVYPIPETHRHFTGTSYQTRHLPD